MTEKRVDIIVIGAMKCGTTTLSDLLAKHPGVSFSSNKEPHFFSKEEHWREKLNDYHALFSDESKLWAEASTSYTFYPHFSKRVWKDLYEYNPKLKLIYMYRDPIQRCISHYMHAYERGYIDLDLERALKSIPILVNNSRYAMQVKPFIETFGTGQVLLMDLKELSTDRENALNRLATFTGLDKTLFPKESGGHKNSSLTNDKHHYKFDEPGKLLQGLIKLTPQRYKKQVWNRLTGTGTRGFESKPQLSQDWREAIIRLLETDIKAFEKMVDKDLSHWTNP